MATASGDEANLDGLNTSTSASAGTTTASDSKDPKVNNPHNLKYVPSSV